MFIAGILVVGGIVAASHEDHSNYSDYYRDHSQYGDAYLVAEIKSKEAKLEERQKEVERIKKELNNRYAECRVALRNEEKLTEVIKDIEWKQGLVLEFNSGEYKKQLIEKITNDINSEIEKDKKQLEEINAAILKINQKRLSCKAVNITSDGTNTKNEVK